MHQKIIAVTAIFLAICANAHGSSRNIPTKLHPCVFIRGRKSSVLLLRGGSEDGIQQLTTASESKLNKVEIIDTPTHSSPITATEIAGGDKSSATMNPKLANAIQRTGPAIFMMLALFAIINITGEKGVIYGLIPLIQIGMYAEATGIIESFHGTTQEGKLEKWWWFATAFTSTTLRPVGMSLGYHKEYLDLICVGMSSMTLLMVVVNMAGHPNAGAEMFRSYLGKVAAFHFILMVVVGQLSYLIKTVQEFGLGWVLFPAFLVVINDTMAYVFGVLIGNHKLLPRLSPKKTIEGFVGAGFSTIVLAIPLIKKFVHNSPEGGKFLSVIQDGTEVKQAMIVGLYISLVSPFGGFLASAVKRAHGAKDFGSLIPGHGGFCDRFDCQVFTAPFVFFYLNKCFEGSTS